MGKRPSLPGVSPSMALPPRPGISPALTLVCIICVELYLTLWVSVIAHGIASPPFELYDNGVVYVVLFKAYRIMLTPLDRARHAL